MVFYSKYKLSFWFVSGQLGSIHLSPQSEIQAGNEENLRKTDSAPSILNPLETQKRLSKELNLDETEQQNQDNKKPKANTKSIKNKTSNVKTRSNSTRYY